MPAYGEASRTRLATCHQDLQTIFNEVIIWTDCSILCGYRGKGAQEVLHMQGKTRVHWPDSKHNSSPSMAVDAAPYPVNWNDAGRFRVFAGRVFQIADQLLAEGRITHQLRWGGDWDRDHLTIDQEFHDLPHFELVAP